MKSLDKKKPECGGKYCVYKNFGGNCIFCGKKDTMKQKPKELDWEKEFDNLNWNTDKGIMTKARVIKQSTSETVGQITIPVTKEMVKTFIKTLLIQQRTELLKLVNKAFEETVIESEGHEYGFYEKLNNLLK